MRNKLLILALGLTISAPIFLTSCSKKDGTDNPSPTGNTIVPLLSGEQKGTAYTGTVNDFTLAANGSTVVLLAAQNTTGKIYAIELNDNNTAQASANAINTPVTDFTTKIASSMGVAANQVSFVNVEVNPISKAIYVLAKNTQTNFQSIYKITNGGSTVTALDVTNVSYSTINMAGTNYRINDMTWGDNKLYFSYSHASSLNGEVAVVNAPFVHNTNATSRATTVFKSNWGNTYNTDAPLESMTYGEINGEKRLMGVTVCAPGYSFKTSDITSGTGILQVKEYFNLNTGIALKVFCMGSGANAGLVEFHMDGRIVKVGQKYLNESQPANVNNGKLLLTFTGNRANGLTDEDVKVIASSGTYVMGAKYTDSKLLVISNNGTLSTLDI